VGVSERAQGALHDLPVEIDDHHLLAEISVVDAARLDGEDAGGRIEDADIAEGEGRHRPVAGSRRFASQQASRMDRWFMVRDGSGASEPVAKW